MDCGDYISLGSAIVAVVACLWARKALTYQALTELMRDYAQSEMAEAVRLLWEFQREECERKEQIVRQKFKVYIENQKRPDLSKARRQVSHFYQRMAGLYTGCIIPGSVLYCHWREKDLRIIRDVIIPLEETLIEHLREKEGNKSEKRGQGVELEELRVLYKNSNLHPLKAWADVRYRKIVALVKSKKLDS